MNYGLCTLILTPCEVSNVCAYVCVWREGGGGGILRKA